jgi:hypothetical protein
MMVEDRDGVVDDATETDAQPHVEQMRPMSLRHSHIENNSGQ